MQQVIVDKNGQPVDRSNVLPSRSFNEGIQLEGSKCRWPPATPTTMRSCTVL